MGQVNKISSRHYTVIEFKKLNYNAWNASMFSSNLMIKSSDYENLTLHNVNMNRFLANSVYVYAKSR